MILDLDRYDLMSLVKGKTPNYSVMHNPLVEKHGYYTGGIKDEWTWNFCTLHDCSDESLYEIYLICKNSWK